MLALDPPLGQATRPRSAASWPRRTPGRCATATARRATSWSGMTVALSDGTVAQSGGKVIKNVAGYDLAKLFAGSYGTLGAILEVARAAAPARRERRGDAARSSRRPPPARRRGAGALPRRIELEWLDVRWEDGAGAVLARFGGAAAAAAADGRAPRSRAAARWSSDEPSWWGASARRSARTDGVVVRVSGVQSQLARVLEAAERARARVVGRAALGLSWVALAAARRRGAGCR